MSDNVSFLLVVLGLPTLGGLLAYLLVKASDRYDRSSRICRFERPCRKLIDTRQWDALIGVAAKWHTFAPMEPLACLCVAYGHEQMGRLDAARSSYRATLDINPGFEPAVDGLKRLAAIADGNWTTPSHSSAKVLPFEKAAPVQPQHVDQRHALIA
jgi:hypothetical protein